MPPLPPTGVATLFIFLHKFTPGAVSYRPVDGAICVFMNSVNALAWNPTVVLIMESVGETERSFRVLILHPHASEIYGDIDAGRIKHQIPVG